MENPRLPEFDETSPLRPADCSAERYMSMNAVEVGLRF